jgi:hypothetical protein
MNTRDKGEVKYQLISFLGRICGMGAVVLFIMDQIILGFVAGIVCFALIPVAHRVLDRARIDEAMEAKAEWDRQHGTDQNPGPG